MERGKSGQYVPLVGTADEGVRAFVPAPLPPTPPVTLDTELQRAHDRALLALGRLDGLAAFVPDIHLFLYTYVRREAVLSSQIEGTQSSLSDLLRYEVDKSHVGLPADVEEVSSYVAALEHGLSRVREGFPISNRLLRETHAILLREGRGSDKRPGQFRRSQNWIGGNDPGTAHFVPPPWDKVEECMAALEHFLHDESPVLTKAGLAHLQFETIHPFLDGNGRVGRLLIILMLVAEGVLREPLLYVSLHFKQRRDDYYRLLDGVRRTGDWEAWLRFFFDAVEHSAATAVKQVQTLSEIANEDQAQVAALGLSAGSAAQVHAALRERPLTDIGWLVQRTGLSFPTVAKALENLVSLDIVEEVTGRQRNRVFCYSRYLAVLEV